MNVFDIKTQCMKIKMWIERQSWKVIIVLSLFGILLFFSFIRVLNYIELQQTLSLITQEQMDAAKRKEMQYQTMKSRSEEFERRFNAQQKQHDAALARAKQDFEKLSEQLNEKSKEPAPLIPAFSETAPLKIDTSTSEVLQKAQENFLDSFDKPKTEAIP